MASSITAENLRKAYGKKEVLRGVSFCIEQGETFALLGVNGAGKTTTIEIIENMRRADSGGVTVNGILGVQLQSTSLPETITSSEAMRLFCAWHKVPYRGDLLERFDMAGEYLNMIYAALSTGRKRRLHLALALCHNPSILILDEPTAGLDVEGRHALHDEIRKLKSEGVSILMATHDMSEAETLCDRIAILRGGVITKLGSPLELTASSDIQSKITVKTRGSAEYKTFSAINTADFLTEFLLKVKAENDEITDLRVERADIEDIFLEAAGGAK
ncbi:MAG: ABC transporter ATP-binding protein [Oscillospiraceae bacterium]|jgi:ABC-2 type transport system ATP-binding protein|nr:ABC transporter ATP-binding protein [Oscillospiraceae bacterium]